MIDDYFYVNGGTTGWEYNSETHRLNLSTSEWKDLDEDNETGPFPKGR